MIMGKISKVLKNKINLVQHTKHISLIEIPVHSSHLLSYLAYEAVIRDFYILLAPKQSDDGIN